MVKKEAEMEDDPRLFNTNKDLLETLGLLKRANSGSLIRAIVIITLVTTGLFHYALKVVFNFKILNLFAIVKILHLVCIYLVCSFNAFISLINSHYLYEMDSIITSGFYEYSHGLTKRQILIRSEANHRASKITKYGPWVFILGTLGSATKEPWPYDFDKWYEEYGGWIPFVVNSWPRYIWTQVYHLMSAMSAALIGGCMCITFITLAEHLLAQLEILCISIRAAVDTIPRRGDKVAEKIVLSRIRECIQHHQAILRYHSKFQRYYNTPLLTFLSVTSIVMCTMAYLLTDPSTTIAISIAFLSLLAPEIGFAFCYCTYGQKIIDMDAELRTTISESSWYMQSVPAQKALMVMLMRTQKPLILSGSVLMPCSFVSFGEIIQTTYTYFNMLQVVRKKQNT